MSIENFIEPQCIDEVVFDAEGNSCLKEELHIDGFGSVQDCGSKRVSAKEILMLILSFLLVAVCALVTAWMVYNIFTTGSAFPTDLIMSSSSDLISKGFKGVKL